MKILYVCPWYVPAWEYGGSLRVAHATATRLADRGHDVTVFTTDTAGTKGRVDYDTPVDKEGVTVHYFKNISNLLTRTLLIPTPVGMRTKLQKEINSFDLVHIHEFYNIPALLAAWIAKKNNIPYVISPHGTVERPGESHSRFKTLYNKALGSIVFSHASRIIALTEDEQNRLETAGLTDENVEIIPNGITANNFVVPERKINAFRNKYCENKGKIVLFLGQLHVWKGLDVLVEAAQRVIQRNENPVNFIVIGGDHGYKSTLIEKIAEAELSENFQVLGFVSEEEKKIALNAADVFTLPSRGEGQPMAVLEALACGTPVIISTKCSLQEVSRANAGRVIPPEPDSLANTINELLRSEKQLCSMETNAKDLVKSEFSWDSVVERLEREYSRIDVEEV